LSHSESCMNGMLQVFLFPIFMTLALLTSIKGQAAVFELRRVSAFA
jgi:hypothetical protein